VRLAGVAVLLALALPAMAVSPKPPPKPTPAESVDAAIARIGAALRIKGCNGKLRSLMHSEYGPTKASGCSYLRQGLGTFKSPHGLAYGTAAEIDAGTGYSQPATTVLALDHDRRFHIAFIQFEYGSIGSKPNPAFDRNVRLALAALRRADCSAFVKVAFRKFGLGGGPETSVCTRLPRNTLHVALAADGTAKPVKLGGNSLYAFYGLTANGGYWTIVMAQQPPSPSLPIGSAQYAFVDAYPAN
jgi:hypothetical protein